MFSWLRKRPQKELNVSEELKKLYKEILLPLENYYSFHHYHSPPLDDADFVSKPMILLVGQYSTGKTTFIRYLLESDFPGMRIGPEPTTDHFTAIMHGENDGIVPGNVAVVDPSKPFKSLSKFGTNFLNRFQCSMMNNDVLNNVTIIDSPGILSGEKQRIDRGYDFAAVLEWFAQRVDRIILLFDAYKLDISDEFKRCIEVLAGNEDKIRVVLNKADMVDHQQLMRIYGALMWSLGKVLRTPEVTRVYIGSFWDQPVQKEVFKDLFEQEHNDLFNDLQTLPKNSLIRKFNDFIKRARMAKAHAFLISELKKEMPNVIGKEKKKKELISHMDEIYKRISQNENIPMGDFPDKQKTHDLLLTQDFTKFKGLKLKLVKSVDEMIVNDIAHLMTQLSEEISIEANRNISHSSIKSANDNQHPFAVPD